jgi:hypothetical protein
MRFRAAFAMLPAMNNVTTQLEEPHNEEEQLVLEWRVTQLERLGVSRLTATMFANLVDWHAVAALVRRGCPADLAIDIVW